MKLATGGGVRVWPARISERRQLADSCPSAGASAEAQLHPRIPGGFAAPHHSEQTSHAHVTLANQRRPISERWIFYINFSR